MARTKIEIVDKLFENQLIILKQSEKSFQGKIYLGKKTIVLSISTKVLNLKITIMLKTN